MGREEQRGRGCGEKLLSEGRDMIYNKDVTSFLSGSATERRVRA